MIENGNVLLSDDLKEEFFICDLSKCKGACCVEGDSGAPLEKDELNTIDNVIDKVMPYLNDKSKDEISKQGNYVRDRDGDMVTPIINGRECVYAFYDEKKILKCGFEAAYRDGKTSFPKPISCHLYPLRVKKYNHVEAVNYDRWHICSPACDLGYKEGLPLYKFLKGPLIRKYGEEWYDELERLIEL